MAGQDKLDQLVAQAGKDGKITKDEQTAINKARRAKGANVYLAYARMAVTHIKGVMGPAANWDQHLPTSVERMSREMRARNHGELTPDDRAALTKAETATDQCVYGQVKNHPDHPGRVQRLKDIRKFAELARQHGCGNCGEVAARTFMYLYDLGVRPLDYMILDGADHSFVVVGRVSQDPDPLKWGDATVCDPWAAGLQRVDHSQTGSSRITTFGDAYTVYPATQLGKKMLEMFPAFTGLLVEHREA